MARPVSFKTASTQTLNPGSIPPKTVKIQLSITNLFASIFCLHLDGIHSG